MKKFLLYLLVLVFMISFIGLIFYLTRPDETISANSETIYLNVGEESTPNFLVENEKKSTTVTITTSDESIAKIEDNKIIAQGKGMAIVSITLKNARKKEQVIKQTIYVGDGSSAEFPIYVRNETDLTNIGTKYATSLYFRQTNDIVLTNDFKTITGEFTGVYDGDSYVISGYKQSGEKSMTAMFETIAESGKVGYIIFDGVNISGKFDNASVLAHTNKGLIDYVEVRGKIENTNLTGTCASIAINNIDNGQIQRCVSKTNIVTHGKTIGGIVVLNKAIITSCQNGDPSSTNPINSNFEFVSAEINGVVSGGIVAKNAYVSDDATKITNCYSINQVITSTENVYWFDGSSWVKLTKGEGNLYTSSSAEHFIIDKTASENGLFVDKNKNGAFDEGVDEVLSIWSSASELVVNLIKFSNNSFIGGIIGADYTDGETYVEQSVKKTSAIYGNYYLIASNFDIVKRGIGNVSTTVPDGEKYVANGLPYGVIASPENSIFVSYATSFKMGSVEYKSKLKSWPTDVWVLDSSVFPYLIPANQIVNKLQRLTVDLPVFSVTDSDLMINSAEKFITMANLGIFTDPANAGETYYIVADLDFDETPFVMVGSDEKPVVVNIDGTGCTVKNVKITNSTKCIPNSTVTTIGEAKAENVGFFGVVKNCTLEGINLKNCVFNAIGDIDCAKNIGGFAGKAIDSEIKLCSFTTDVNEDGSYVSSISIPVSGENAGGLVGVADGCTISGSTSVMELAFASQLSHKNGLYVGGLVGSLGKEQASTISACEFNGKITSNMNESVYVGSAAGFVLGTSIVNNFKATDAKINSAFAGGIASVNKGTIKNSSVRTIIGAKNAGGFVWTMEDSARVENCYCETEFTESSAEVNAGMASSVSKTSHFTNCVNVNKFHNDGDAGKNYSRVAQNVKFEFSVTNSAVSIDELNEYGSGYAYDEIILTNCFYVNSIYNDKTGTYEDSNDYSKTTFYTQANSNPSGAVFGVNHVDDKVSIFRVWYNGTLRNGRLKTVGGLAAGPNTDATWADLGFDSSIWQNANNGIMSSTLYMN